MSLSPDQQRHRAPQAKQYARARGRARWSVWEIVLLAISVVMIASPLFAAGYALISPTTAPARESTIGLAQTRATATPCGAICPTETSVPTATVVPTGAPFPTDAVDVTPGPTTNPYPAPYPAPATATATATATSAPTATPTEVSTPEPTATSAPTATDAPVNTPAPTTAVSVLRVTKEALGVNGQSIALVSQGSEYLYSIRVDNPVQPAVPVDLIDSLTQGLEPVAIVGVENGTCALAGSTLTCSLRPSVGQIATVLLRVRVTAPGGTVLPNTASASVPSTGERASGSARAVTVASDASTPLPATGVPTAPAASPVVTAVPATGVPATVAPVTPQPTAPPASPAPTNPPSNRGSNPAPKPEPKPKPSATSVPRTTPTPITLPVPNTPLPHTTVPAVATPTAIVGVPAVPPTAAAQPSITSPTAAAQPSVVPPTATVRRQPAGAQPQPTAAPSIISPTAPAAAAPTVEATPVATAPADAPAPQAVPQATTLAAPQATLGPTMAPVTTPQPDQPSMRFNLASDWGQVFVGDTFEFTVSLQNAGNEAGGSSPMIAPARRMKLESLANVPSVDDIVISDDLDPAFEVLEAQGQGLDVTVTDQKVEARRASLAGGELVTLKIKVRARSVTASGTTILNQASLSYRDAAQTLFSNVVAVTVVTKDQPTATAAPTDVPTATAEPILQAAGNEPVIASPEEIAQAPLPTTSGGTPLWGVVLLGLTLLLHSVRAHRARIRI